MKGTQEVGGLPGSTVAEPAALSCRSHPGLRAPPQGGQRSMVPSQHQASGWLSPTHPYLSWTLLPSSLSPRGCCPRWHKS